MLASIKTADILRYWHDVEMFSAQRIAPCGPGEKLIAVDSAEVLCPWQPAGGDAFPALPETHERRFSVYAGVIRYSDLRAGVASRLGEIGQEFNQETDFETALLAFSLTADGRPLFAHIDLSTAAWACGRLLHGELHHGSIFSGYEADRNSLGCMLREAFALDEADLKGAERKLGGEDVGRCLDAAGIMRLAGLMAKEFGVSALVQPRIMLITSVHRRGSPEVRRLRLNSPFLGSISTAAAAVDARDIGPALEHYLGHDESSTSTRIDVRYDDVALESLLSPERFPRGCWLLHTGGVLEKEQQVAVNAVLHPDAANVGLSSVHAPRGTDKLSVLRNVVAAVVVERARRLSELPSAKSGFADSAIDGSIDGRLRHLYPLAPEIAGFEIVLSGSHPALVEEMASTLCDAASTPCGTLDPANSFADFAAQRCGEPAWELAALDFGSPGRVRQVIERLWLSDSSATANSPRAQVGLRAWLTSCAKDREGALQRWRAAVAGFRAAFAREEEIGAELQALDDAVRRVPAILAQLEGCRNDIAKYAGERDAMAQECLFAQTIRDQKELALRAATAALGDRATEVCRPAEGPWGMAVLHRREAGPADARVARYERALQELRTADLEVLRCRQEIAAIDDEIDDDERRIAALAEELSIAEVKAAEARIRMGGGDCLLPGADAPWSDATWIEARGGLFLRAMELHRAFLAVNAAQFKELLEVAFLSFAGRLPGSFSDAPVLAALQAVFFVAPVMAAPLATLDVLLHPFGREAVGLLVIDDADSAAPQAAVGAIWRARSTLVFGDRSQPAPATSCPFAVQELLRDLNDVSPRFLPAACSVLSLSDAQSQFGTAVGPFDDRTWVGVPLRRQRGVPTKLAELANHALYGGMMLLADAPSLPADEEGSFKPSLWVDVPTTETIGDWSPAEGRSAMSIIRYYLDRCAVAPADIVVLAPLRDVAQAMRRLLEGTGVIACSPVEMAERVAKVVVVVLGGAPGNTGLVSRVASSSALLAVAATRATARLYLVGDASRWAIGPYMSAATHFLPLHSSKHQ